MGIMVRDRPAQESALMEPRCGNFLHSGALQPEHEQLPSGWEKCLDLKSGLIYFKDWNSGTMTYRDPRQRMRRTTVWMESAAATETTTPSTTASLQITTDDEEQSLELSLNLPGSNKSSGTALKSSSSKSQEESVCTMEKVRLALDRLTNSNCKKRSVSGSSRESNSPSTTTTSNSDECFTSPSAMSYEGDDEDDEPEVQQAPKAAPKVAVPELVMGIVGCKSCLMYVMLSKSHPCCPKCGNTDVLLELPEAKPVSKKQRTLQLESSSPRTTWSWCTA